MELKKKGGHSTSLHSAISDSARVRRVESLTHALNMMHAPLVIMTKHYVVFVLPPLFIWLIKHPFGLALLPPGYGVKPVMQTNVDVVSHVDNGQNMNGFMRLDTHVYVRKHNHRPGDERLCMRKSMGMHSLLSTVWRNPKKNQK